MEWQTFTRAVDALEKAQSFLEQREVQNNLSLGILLTLAGSSNSPAGQEPLLWMASDITTPVLFLLMTPPHHLILAGSGVQAQKAAEQAADRLKEKGWSIPSVIGEPPVAEAFAKAWTKQNGSAYSTFTQQRIYKLETVAPPSSYSEGRIRLAAEGDQELAARWLEQFFSDVHEPITTEAAYRKARDLIASASLFLWDLHGPVCMAAKTRPTRNGIVISMVYTPPENRKKGYASTCVAILSQQLLDAGYQFCSLYTDLANPTSNRIYQAIGYRPIQDSVVLKFDR